MLKLEEARLKKNMNQSQDSIVFCDPFFFFFFFENPHLPWDAETSVGKDL